MADEEGGGQDLTQTLTQEAANANAKTVFECPECKADGIEKILASPQGLARHRSVAHGVRGQSRRTRSRNGTRPRQKPAVKQFDRTAAIRAVSPDGLVRVDDMERLSLWLDQGEAIFNSRRPGAAPAGRKKKRR